MYYQNMKKYIYLVAFLIHLDISAEELKYECDCKYAEIFVSDPIEGVENTQEDPNCEMLYEGNAETENFIINFEDKYVYNEEYSEMKAEIEKINDAQYHAYISNEQFREMFEKEKESQSVSEEMSDFAKGMIEMLGGMLDFSSIEQKTSFEILIDGRIQQDNEISIEMNFAEMFKGLDIPMDDDFANIEKFVTKISSYSMCEEKS
tara:strand:+ start:119 stop:733 length:615 start_codon:yes stop_codon:yes gene_type:complete